MRSPDSIEALERELTSLASHIHAATCRWLGLLAEFDAREGWAAWGCRSCADWVSWRCGIAPVAAREHVRVARRLGELPLVRDAFAEGRLSYSKVRALTRVEGVEREQELLELASHTTAAQLERLLRAYRGVVAVERAAAGGRPERWLTWDHDDDGSLLLRGRLPAEEGALVIAALEAAREHAAAELERGQRDASAEAPVADVVDASAEAPVADVVDASAEAPAAEVVDASAEAPVADVVDASAEAPAPTAGEARADALVTMAETLLAAGPVSRAGGDRHQVVVHVEATTLRGDARAGRCELDGGVPLAAETARRLACDAALVPLVERAGRPLSVGRKTRAIPPALQRALASRDGGCRFPGCGARRLVDAHHIQHWAYGGETSLTNLVQLCRHHHRLLHEGGYRVAHHHDDRFTFHRPDGRPIRACPPAPRGRATGLGTPDTIAPDACRSLSAGEHMDLDLAVDAVLAFAPPPSPAALAIGV